MKPLDRPQPASRPRPRLAPARRATNGVARAKNNGAQTNGASQSLAVVEPIVVAAEPIFVAAEPIVATPLPTVSGDDFRAALRQFPSGVTIVTLRVGEEVHGLTVSAFASISPSPPLVMVAIDHRHHAHEMLEQEGVVLGINILHEGQRELSDRFAWVKDEDRFAVGRWITAATGAPLLADAAAWLDCTIHSSMPAGSHTIFVGEVRAAGVAVAERPPLIYWCRGYRALDLRPPGSTQPPAQ
ncbi:MAG TPA: flavin reductase family protein [Thermoanaerobaculia bacterium]|nr:flavin reductase family protein [Thermoanaerobaculia bacterium]